MGLKYFGTTHVHDIENREFLEKNGLNHRPPSSHLLANSDVYYSKDLLVMTDCDSVSIFTISTIVEVMVTDIKFRCFLGIEDFEIQDIIEDLTIKEVFTSDVLSRLFSSTPTVRLQYEEQDTDYILNHFLKRSNLILLLTTLKDTAKRQGYAPDSKAKSLVLSGLDKVLIKLKIARKKDIIYAYLNIRDDQRFIYPVVHILDFNHYALYDEGRYYKFFIPTASLSPFLYSNVLQVEVPREDIQWNSRLCEYCGFTEVSDAHRYICNFLKGEINSHEESKTMDECHPFTN